MRQYGWDAKLTDLLPTLVADCPERRAASVYDRCRAMYERREARTPLGHARGALSPSLLESVCR
jgi:hypothetical protein